MEINNQHKPNQQSNSDAGLTAQNMQLIKQTLPLLDFSAQKQITILMKIIELKNTIRNFQSNSFIPIIETEASNAEKSTKANVNSNRIPFQAPSPFSNFMESNPVNNSSSNNMLNNMMMLMNMMNNNNTSPNLSAAELGSSTQKPPDVNGFVNKFKQTLTEEQRNMFNTFSTLMQTNSMQERNSARNDDV